MNDFPTAILDRQRVQAADTMRDRCQVLAHAQTGTDGHNRPVYGYTAGAEIACGVQVVSNRQAVDAEGNVALVDYKLRLPHGTAVARLDRIRITQRHGVASWTAADCEILGQVELGETAVLLKVKVLTHGQ